MRFFLDRNLSPIISSLLNGMGFESVHHDTVFSSTTSDPDIIKYVADNDYVLITYDHRIRKIHQDSVRRYQPRIIFLTSTIRLKNIEDQKRWFRTTWVRVATDLRLPPLAQISVGVNGEVRRIVSVDLSTRNGDEGSPEESCAELRN